VSASPRPNTGPQTLTKARDYRKCLPSFSTLLGYKVSRRIAMPPSHHSTLPHSFPPCIFCRHCAQNHSIVLQTRRASFSNRPFSTYGCIQAENPLSTHNMALAHRASSRKSTFPFRTTIIRRNDQVKLPDIFTTQSVLRGVSSALGIRT